jgi:hypothetical protein
MNNIHKSKKNFIEPNDEIVFVLEKIISDSNDRLILVVPTNALLLSSVPSIKILSRQMLYSSKDIIVVCDSEIVSKIGEKAGLVFKQKLSDIDKDAWLEARELKEKLLAERNRIKKELLQMRQDTDLSDQDLDELTNVAVIEPVPTVKAQIVSEEPEFVDVEPIIQKVRLEEKVINVNGITIVAGGDIALNEDLLQLERERIANDRSIYEQEELEPFEIEQANVYEDEIIEEESTNLVGRDITSITEDEPIKLPKKNEKLKKYVDLIKSNSTKVINYLKIEGRAFNYLKITIALVLIFFVFSYIFLPAVTITVKFKEAELNLEYNLVADPAISTVDIANLTLPGTKISKDTSGSADGRSTGVGAVGENAKGLIDIWNKTGQDIKIPSGKTITHISSQLKYVIQREVTIPKETSLRDIPIRAEKIGSNYNIINKEGSYQIDGFTTDQVIARSFLDISGGTSKDVTVLSQADIDNVKNSLVSDLKNELQNSLSTLISSDDLYLEGTEKFEEVEFKSSAKVGDEVTSFSVDIKMNVSAKKILKSDISKLITEKIKAEQGNTDAAKIEIINTKVSNIKSDGAKTAFVITAEASIQEDFDTTEIKNDLRGMKISEAKEYMDKLEGIDTYVINYKPSYIPSFLQKIPNDIDNITIKKASNTNTDN